MAWLIQICLHGENMNLTYNFKVSIGTLYRAIIPTPHHYGYFAQFDWLEKMFYSSINSMSKNFRTIFIPLAHKMYNKVDKNMVLMTITVTSRLNTVCGDLLPMSG